MQGHKRENNSPVCPTRRSPYVSRDFPAAPFLKARSSTPEQPKPRVSESPFVVPPLGVTLRRPNPNWQAETVTPLRHVSPAGSLVPTVLVDDDGNTIRGAEDDDADNGHTTTTDILMGQFSKFSKPIVSIFSTRREDIPYIKNRAARMGVHAGVLHNPVKSRPGVGSSRRGLLKESSWWLVLGQNAEFVRNIVDSQQRGMPGTIADEASMMEGPRMVTFLQLVLAAVIGGFIVVGGLSLL